MREERRRGRERERDGGERGSLLALLCDGICFRRERESEGKRETARERGKMRREGERRREHGERKREEERRGREGNFRKERRIAGERERR